MACSKVQALGAVLLFVGTALVIVSVCTDNWLFHQQGMANGLMTFEQRRGLWRQCIVVKSGQLGTISPGCQNLFAPAGSYDANSAIYGSGLGAQTAGGYGQFGNMGLGMNGGAINGQYSGIFGQIYRPVQST